jgi:glycine/D-amino acid oxidase-like deaminating enzyme
VIGPDEELRGFHWAAGLGGAGIMAAPAVGEIVAEGVIGGVQPLNWKTVAPSRSIAEARYG